MRADVQVEVTARGGKIKPVWGMWRGGSPDHPGGQAWLGIDTITLVIAAEFRTHTWIIYIL
jgi:hypothetical protein